MLRAIWQSREFIASLVRRELQVRSARALWGSMWLVLEPAAQIFVYTLIFGRVLGARMPGVENELAYGIFICAGIITWNFFAELVNRSQTVFLEHAGLLKTMSFPRSALIVALVANASINFAIVAAIFMVALGLAGAWPGWALLGALPLLGIQACFGVGIGVLTGTVNVFFRDVARSVGVAMQFGFWLTPIVYPISIVPEGFRRAYDWNPMVPIVEGYQRIVIAHAMPEWESLGWPLLLSMVVLVLGWGVFRKLGPDLVDEL
jgi:lipopolysaccharide transport system permease protein